MCLEAPAAMRLRIITERDAEIARLNAALSAAHLKRIEHRIVRACNDICARALFADERETCVLCVKAMR